MTNEDRKDFIKDILAKMFRGDFTPDEIEEMLDTFVNAFGDKLDPLFEQHKLSKLNTLQESKIALEQQRADVEAQIAKLEGAE